MPITIIRKQPVAVEQPTPTQTLTPEPTEAPAPISAPTVPQMNAFTQALSLGKPIPEPIDEPALQPWDLGPNYTILDALKEFSEKKRTQALKLMHRHTVGCSYLVKSYDHETGRAVLEGGFKGGLLKPVISEREVEIYYPVWM